VNDANILIDLVKLELLPHFFVLDLEFYTSDLILQELHHQQLQQFQKYIDNNKLKVISFSAEELFTIGMLQIEKPALSQQDCSAILSAQKVNGKLVTSDGNLRKFAGTKNISVRGHLWVFDLMVKERVITGTIAIEKLNYLREVINPWLALPKNECDIRIDMWKETMICYKFDRG